MAAPERPWEQSVVTSPATGAVLGRVEETPIARVPELYRRSRSAFSAWGATSSRARTAYLKRLRLAVVDRLDEIAQLIADSTGKPVAEALVTELLPTLDAMQHLEKYAPRVLRCKRVPTSILLPGKTSYIEYAPRGVVLVLAPWNFPLQLAMIPVVTALAAGNTVILKPSEITPLIGRLMENLFKDARFPDDVVQVAHGDGRLGAALVQGSPDHIFFTGSWRTGKRIQVEAAKQLISTTLELSGHDAMIVFDDAPMERAVNAAVWGGFMNSGQTCVGVERIYVHRTVYPEFTRLVVSETSRLKQGVRADADLGAMTFDQQVEIVQRHVTDALTKGATLLYGRAPDEWDGMVVPPIILTDVTEEMTLARDEAFGPVVTVIPFDDEDEVVDLANASPYGLSASVWSAQVRRAERVASRLETGSVVINDVIVAIANHHLPFGGVKQSGLGSYHGEAGLKAMSREKSVVRDWLGRKREANWFPYEGKAPLFARLLRSYFGTRRHWVRFLGAFFGLMRRS